jgi:hypothetical protein
MRATTLAGAPLPPTIFKGSTIIVAPIGGSREILSLIFSIP